MTDAPSVRFATIRDALPPQLAELRTEARAEGYAFLDRLAELWESGAMRFDGPDERLIGAYDGATLLAVGAVSHDRYVPGTLRIRRFYVRISARGAGLGRRLAAALLADVAPDRTVTLHAGTAAAARFWEAIGFRAETHGTGTHVRSGGERPQPTELQ